MKIAAHDPGITSCLMVSLQPQSLPAVSDVLQADWNKATSLEGAALHRSLGTDALVELTLWSSTDQALHRRNSAVTQRILKAAPGAAVETHSLALVRVTAGPGHRGGGLALHIEPGSNRPVLVAVFDPIHRGRPALLQYLNEAGDRFATQLDGWTGAALFCDNDRQQVVEYLQFDSMEASGASQASPIIRAHQAELQNFGNVAANVYMVDAVFRR
jgi:hypothetical protein